MAAAPTLVSRSDDAPPLTFSLGTDGAGYDHIIQPLGRYRVPFSHIFEENRPFYEEVTDARGVPGVPWMPIWTGRPFSVSPCV